MKYPILLFKTYVGLIYLRINIFMMLKILYCYLKVKVQSYLWKHDFKYSFKIKYGSFKLKKDVIHTLDAVTEQLPEEGQHGLGSFASVPLHCGKLECHEIVPGLRLN